MVCSSYAGMCNNNITLFLGKDEKEGEREEELRTDGGVAN